MRGHRLYDHHIGNTHTTPRRSSSGGLLGGACGGSGVGLVATLPLVHDGVRHAVEGARVGVHEDDSVALLAPRDRTVAGQGAGTDMVDDLGHIHLVCALELRQGQGHLAHAVDLHRRHGANL